MERRRTPNVQRRTSTRRMAEEGLKHDERWRNLAPASSSYGEQGEPICLPRRRIEGGKWVLRKRRFQIAALDVAQTSKSAVSQISKSADR